jgi:peptidylprolyl isomerase domain and WD repeat-containing protein 1
VKFIKFNRVYSIALSVDGDGMMEYWSPETLDFPGKGGVGEGKGGLKFQFKIETDLFDLKKCKTNAIAVGISNNGKMVGVYGRDRYVRLFNFLTGKLMKKIDESLDKESLLKQQEVFNLERIDFDRRIAVEKEIDKSVDHLLYCTIEFDENDQLLIYPTLFGIKVVDIQSGETLRVLGKMENNERFMKCVLYQGKPMKNNSNQPGK